MGHYHNVSVAILLLTFGVLAQAASVEFVGTASQDAPEGHILLDWTPTELRAIETYELQGLAPGGAFRTRYEGPDTASFLSGLSAGEHRFRVRAAQPQGPWSEVLVVKVSYPSMAATARWLMLGGAVFVLTVGALLFGMRRESRDGNAGAADGG